MKKTYEIAGQVMGFFDAFKGSRPAIDNERILIVRGRSRKILPLNEFSAKLSEIGEILEKCKQRLHSINSFEKNNSGESGKN